MESVSCDVLVLGAGPGGYVAAIRSSQLGLDTIVVEDGTPGGTCLTVGCIPSKAIIHAAGEYYKLAESSDLNELGISTVVPELDLAKTQLWKGGIVRRLTGGVASLLKKSGVRHIIGWGVMQDGKTCRASTSDGEVRISARNVILATGSEPVELSSLPFDGTTISSTKALELDAVPETLAVIGGGYIGVELGSAFARFGSKVTIVEATDRLLPLYDAELVVPITRSLKKLGVKVLLDSKATARRAASLAVEMSDGENLEVEADYVLVTVGRRPLVNGWGRENLVLDMAGSSIAIDEHCRTSMSGVYAVGDVTGEPMLAHRAMAQAEVVTEIIAGKHRVFDPIAIPAICFTDPEIITVGLSAKEAAETGYDVKVSKFPFAANGRAMTMQAEDGFVRVISDAGSEKILGLAAVGTGVSELASSFSLALEMGACLEDIATTIHAHPTLGEAIQEASFLAQGRALHL